MPDSSPETAPVETQVAPGSQGANTSDSPPAENEGATSIFEAVDAALKSGQEEKSPGSEQGQTDPDPVPTSDAAKAEEEELGELTDDELKRYAPKTQRRIRQLLDQRAEKDTEIAGLKPRADGYDQLQTFVANNRLSSEDLSLGLNFIALRKSDPAKAWEMIQPVVKELAEFNGLVLPPELQERVNLGYLSEKDARDLVVAQRRVDHSTKQAEEDAKRREEDARRKADEDAAKEAQAIAAQAEQTASEWEAAKKRSDPEWSLKERRIAVELENRLLKDPEKFPRDKASTVKMLDEIYAAVTQELKPLVASRPKSIKPVTGVTSSGAVAEPKTMMEAIEHALAVG